MAGIKGSSLSEELLEHVRQLPQGKSIDKCIQCGTCSGSCPTSGAMEYGPREIIAALRAGGLPLFYVPVVMRVFHMYSPCLEEGVA